MISGPRQKSVSQSHFAMVPRNDVPRSAFKNRSGHKTTFDAGYLIPIYMNEVLPGDTFRMSMTAFCRLQTLIFPLLDNLYLDTFWFFVPCRLVWKNWQRFMGEQIYPNASTDFTVPIMANSVYGGATPGELADYFGLPSNDQVTGTLSNINALPFRAYQRIWNEWFRDENLQNNWDISIADPYGDGPDVWTGGDGYTPTILRRRGKRHDYFTSCLPWPQKGTAINALSGLAPVKGLGITSTLRTTPGSTTPTAFYETPGGSTTTYPAFTSTATAGIAFRQKPTGGVAPYEPDVWADLSQATGATINALRQAFMIQNLMERDARGGTRYIEILRSHFGVVSPDARLQRPEYLGGNSTPIHINPVAQTSVTAATPQGNLAGVGTGVHQSGFHQSFTEHGYLFCLANVRADLTYQQGYHKLWYRRTRYDFYWPAFAHLGEQAVLRKEIYAVGDPNFDELVFGYQERWGEYRYFPSKITGKFRSGITGTLDAWHMAQNFTSAPTLGDTFIQDTPPMSRVLAAGTGANNQQFMFDSVFDAIVVRAMPTYSVPGLGSRF